MQDLIYNHPVRTNQYISCRYHIIGYNINRLVSKSKPIMMLKVSRFKSTINADVIIVSLQLLLGWMQQFQGKQQLNNHWSGQPL